MLNAVRKKKNGLAMVLSIICAPVAPMERLTAGRMGKNASLAHQHGKSPTTMRMTTCRETISPVALLERFGCRMQRIKAKVRAANPTQHIRIVKMSALLVRQIDRQAECMMIQDGRLTAVALPTSVGRPMRAAAVVVR